MAAKSPCWCCGLLPGEAERVGEDGDVGSTGGVRKAREGGEGLCVACREGGWGQERMDQVMTEA